MFARIAAIGMFGNSFPLGLCASVGLHIGLIMIAGALHVPLLAGGGGSDLFDNAIFVSVVPGAGSESARVGGAAPAGDVPTAQSDPASIPLELPQPAAPAVSQRKQPAEAGYSHEKAEAQRKKEAHAQQAVLSAGVQVAALQAAGSSMADGGGGILGGAGAFGAQGGGTLGVGDGSLKRPALKRAPKPPYPSGARMDGFEGSVAMEVFIDTDGQVTDARVLRSSGRDDCDASATRTILSQWRFIPATARGIAVPWREKVVVKFTLR